LCSMTLRIERVRKDPSSKTKTGKEGFKDWPNLLLRFFSAFTGLTLQLLISKRYTISPCGVLLFGILIFKLPNPP
jgi:hypothetical protein